MVDQANRASTLDSVMARRRKYKKIMVQEIDIFGTYLIYCRGPSRGGNGVAIALGKQIDTFGNLPDNFINSIITEYLSIMIMISAIILHCL